MIQFKDECLKEGIGVLLRTDEQDLVFRTWLHSKGKRRNDGNSYHYQSKLKDWSHIIRFPSDGKCGFLNIEEYDNKTILSYEEALLEEECQAHKLTDLIDFDKCDDYIVKEDDYDGLVRHAIRKGLFIHNKRLYCYYKNDTTMPLKSYTYYNKAIYDKEPFKELSIEDIQKELGYKIKIIEK